MKRRMFLKNSSEMSLGLWLTSSFLFSSCRKQELFEDTDFDGKVIIVGAGAAGLYAGYVLKSRGIDFSIIEASERAGGRIGKIEGFADFTLDAGAQWLHGKNNIIGDFIQKTDTKISRDDSDAVFWFQQSLVDELPEDIQSIFEEQENLPDISFIQHAENEGFGDDYAYIVENIAGDQGADASFLSVSENVREEENWVSGDNDYKFEKSYYDFFNDHIIPEISEHIILNSPISKVNYETDEISITNIDGNVHVADKLIVTVPITILQGNDIEFVPPLSESKIQAFNKIGMGPGMKVFLKFSEQFYDGNIIGGKVCAAYADEKEGKVGSDNVLLAFVMGHQAHNLSALESDDAIAQALLTELDEMYDGQASASFLDVHVEDWTSNPFVRGAYSYSKVGIGNARSVAAESVEGKLFFAGEAMNLNGHHQTVQGAVETGYREVVNILESVNK